MPHEGPPAHTLGMSVPHSTVAGLVVGHRGAHWQLPPTQTWPVGQLVPWPGHTCPGQLLGMDCPHAMVAGAAHARRHSHVRVVRLQR